MNYQEASELGRKIRKLCGQAIHSAKKDTSTTTPHPDKEADIVCLKKAQTADEKTPNETVFCRIMNGSDCPEGISLHELQNLKTQTESHNYCNTTYSRG